MSSVGSDRETQPIARAQDQLFRQPGSARQKYSALVVGRPGWLPLVKHELIVMVSQHVPGALGLALRKWLYPKLLGRCGPVTSIRRPSSKASGSAGKPPPAPAWRW